VDRAVASPGTPLPSGLRNDMEQRFGHDFSSVRVHAGAAAEQSAQDVGARAYTLGRNIIFAAGQLSPTTFEGRRLIAHELAHVVQQSGAEGASAGQGLIQRQPQPKPKPPTYQDCTEATTLSAGNPNKEIEQARDRAKDFVDVAISILAQDPSKFRKGATYPVALARHFISPTAAQQQTIRANFKKIRDQLKPAKIRCAATQADLDVCASDPDGKRVAAFAPEGGQACLCQGFWLQNLTCRALILIHEAAHITGIGVDAPHPPYRGGGADYPDGAEPPSAGQSAPLRMDNPDAYAYFAAHIWREVDTFCVSGELIEITESSDAGTAQLFEQADACAKREALSPFCDQVMKEALNKGWGERKK
jgi:hypothetical protein